MKCQILFSGKKWYFSYFSHKTGFDMSSFGDNLLAMSNPVFLEK